MLEPRAKAQQAALEAGETQFSLQCWVLHVLLQQLATLHARPANRDADGVAPTACLSRLTREGKCRADQPQTLTGEVQLA